MSTTWRVWDGWQMHYWHDEDLSLELKGGNWTLWRDGCRVIVAESGDPNTVLMWGTGVQDEEGKTVYPADEVEYSERNLDQAFGGDGPAWIRKKKVIYLDSLDRHNVPNGIVRKLKVLGNTYEKGSAAE